jgi:Family of unknown function (DUF6049)
MPRPPLTGCAALAVAASVLALTGLAGSRSPAAAATAQPGGARASLVITSVTPAYAQPGQKVTVSGTVTNVSSAALEGVSVQLSSSSFPLESRNDLKEYADGSVNVAVQVTGAVTDLRSRLAPRATLPWSVTLRPSQVPLSGGFGVYPLAAAADSPVFGSLDEERTFLPYWPGKRGPDPQPQQIAWVWPLIDQPRQAMCTGGLVDNGLAASLASGGRLSGLLEAGSQYASRASLTWAIDPGLLANVATMTKPYQVVGAVHNGRCLGKKQPASQAAAAWLAGLTSATAGQPVLVTPYADADIAALTRYGMNADLTRAFTEGRTVASSLLNRDFTGPAGTSSTDLTGMAWPADGIANYGVLENLATNGISTVVLDSSTMPPSSRQSFTPSAQTTTPDGEGPDMKVLLSDQTITQIIASAGSASDSKAKAFAVAQRYLAETAMIAAEEPSVARSIVVTPPRRWDPPAGLAGDLLHDTVSAPWLQPVSLAQLAAAQHPAGQVKRRAPDAVSQAELGRPLLDQARQLDQQVKLLQDIQQSPDPALYYGVAAVESAAWRGGGSAQEQGSDQAQQYAQYLSGQENRLTIIGPDRITLAGLKGAVPVSIYNRLGYAVKVMLEAVPSSGLTVKTPPSLMVIPPGQQVIKKVEVAAATVGPAKLRLRLLTPEGVPFPSQTTVILQATHYGTLALVIIGAALGVFILTAVTRAVRRRRAAPREGPSGSGPGPGPGPDPGSAPEPQPAGRAPEDAGRQPRAAGSGARDTVAGEHDWRDDRGKADNVVTGDPASGHPPARDAAEETDDYAWAPGRADPR